ncbi:MAG: N-acetylmuramoyl-L-alanine amidase [Ruminococcus flavefaciens]|nr:N-acetylmuramoyl-L-alanine amidase [Ruminococcus flavefaciens]
MKDQFREYRSVWLLLAGFCVLAAVVLLSWHSAVRGLPDTVGRTLTQQELAEVIGRNSPLTGYVYLSPNADFPRENAIQKITIHHMADDIALERLGEVFAEQDRQASSNYAIDGQGHVALYVEESNRAWTSSSPDNDHQAVTIEVANDQIGGDWHVSDAAYEALIQLCVDICRRNGIQELVYTGDETGNLTIHKMFNPDTECPGPYLESRMPDIAAEVNRRLENF